MERELSAEARRQQQGGTVVLALVVDKLGLPQEVQVLRSTVHGLDKNAIKAVKQHRFKPATEKGMPVAVSLNIQVPFQLFGIPSCARRASSEPMTEATIGAASPSKVTELPRFTTIREAMKTTRAAGLRSRKSHRWVRRRAEAQGESSRPRPLPPSGGLDCC